MQTYFNCFLLISFKGMRAYQKSVTGYVHPKIVTIPNSIQLNNGEPHGASLFIPKNTHMLVFLVEPTRVFLFDLIKVQLKEVKQQPKSIDYKLQISMSLPVSFSFFNLISRTRSSNHNFLQKPSRSHRIRKLSLQRPGKIYSVGSILDIPSYKNRSFFLSFFFMDKKGKNKRQNEQRKSFGKRKRSFIKEKHLFLKFFHIFSVPFLFPPFMIFFFPRKKIRRT